MCHAAEGTLEAKQQISQEETLKVEEIGLSEGINEGWPSFDNADVLSRPVLPESPLYSPYCQLPSVLIHFPDCLEQHHQFTFDL